MANSSATGPMSTPPKGSTALSLLGLGAALMVAKKGRKEKQPRPTAPNSTAPASGRRPTSPPAPTAAALEARPHPDDEDKVDSPQDLTKPSWKYVGKKTLREFMGDQCTDLAAALTYYAVLALFPAIIALTSILGLVGQGSTAIDTVLDMVGALGGQDMIGTVREPLLALAENDTAGLALILGLAGALWSASGYVGAFSRAMNRIYEIQEGRPIWKLRPQMLLLTLVLTVLTAVVLLGLVLSGDLAGVVGERLGLGDTLVTVFTVVKWPILLAAVVAMVALLYYYTPNVRQPKFRWISMGAGLAILTWILLSVAFGFYVSNFGNYDKTYGTLGGVIAFLLWVWLTNLALLFGAELDAELERGRELQSGLKAEENIQLPPRDTAKIEKDQAKEAKDIEEGRRLGRQNSVE